MEAVGRSLTDAVRKLLRVPNVDEKAVKELVKDLQRTLLQADVNVELVLQLSRSVEERSLKEKLPPGITRREHVVKVLYEEMAKFVGQEPAKAEVQPGTFRKIMLVGIQGTGKTTSSVKLARFFTKRGLRVGLVCADTYRPGAYEQLLQLATKAEIPVYGEPGRKKPEEIAKHGLEHFRKEKSDLVIIDTAGRHRNEKDLMDEMKRIASAVQPDEIVLAIDATIGQQAIYQAKAFHEATPIGSVLLTKMDGSAKGGGALSAVVATGSKVKFIGTGERVEDLELFVPTDFAGRLLGMGDLNALIEKVNEAEVKVPEAKVRQFMETVGGGGGEDESLASHNPVNDQERGGGAASRGQFQGKENRERLRPVRERGSRTCEPVFHDAKNDEADETARANDERHAIHEKVASTLGP